MIDEGMQVVSITIAASPTAAAMRAMGRDLVAVVPVVPTAKALFTADNIAKLLLIGSVVILLLPAMIVVSVVAILVPCFFRVPVCGTSHR